MDVDFVKLLREDQDFLDFTKDVSLEIFVTFNVPLISMIWALYQSGMDKDNATMTIKTIIRNSQPPDNHGGHTHGIR